MKKELLLIPILILAITIASATITIDSQPKSTYKIGDKINLAISINSETKQIILSSTINCPSHNLNYFKTPIDLTTGSNFINIPSITVQQNLLGDCQVEFSLLDLNEIQLEKTNTEQFSITNIIDLEFTTDKTNYLPGETILIEGQTENKAKINSVLTDEGTVLEDHSETLETTKISFSIILDKNLRKGEKTIQLSAEDEKGNIAESSKTITIEQIPKTLELDLVNIEINPSEQPTITSHIYDQAKDNIIDQVSYKVYNPENTVIYTVEDQSETQINIELPENPSPGEYLIKAIHKNLEDIKKLKILEIRDIEINVKDGIVSVVNIGNVKYTDQISINAKSEDGITYQVPLDINLNPGEKSRIDLTSELPAQSYELEISSEDNAIQVEGITINDNRPTVKKVSQSISKITGASIIETNEIGNVFYMFIFILIVGFITVFIIQRRLKTKVMRRIDDTVVVQGKAIGSLKKDKTKLSDMFSTYVDKRLLNKPTNKIIKKEISILFTDIRGFSKIFDNHDSEEIAEMLNLYFGKISEIVKNNNGFINKFIGDSVMALFNSLTNDPNHIIKSVLSNGKLN